MSCERGKSRVSVAVISLNSEKTIGECLRSLGEQSVPPKEVIVVDGGSKDRTLSIAEKSRSYGFPLTVLSDPGGNKSHGANIGIGKSTGEIVAFLDSDCIAPPDWIRTIEANLGPGMEEAVGGPYTPAQDTGFAKTTYNLLGMTAGRITAQFARREDQKRYVRAVTFGDCAFIKSLLVKIGGFDERLTLVDDGDLCQRIGTMGVRVAFIPELHVLHRWSGWEGLTQLAHVSYKWGRGRIGASRINPALSPKRTLCFYLAFIVGFLALAFYSIANGGLGYFALGLVVLYSCVCISVMTLKSSFDIKAMLSPFVFFVAYGAGLLKGFLTPKVSRLRWNLTV